MTKKVYDPSEKHPPGAQQDLNPHGAVGNAARATAERGKLMVDYQAAAFVELLEEMARFDLGRLWTSPA